MRHSNVNRAGSKNRQRIALKITNRFIFDPLLSTRQNEGTSFFRLTDSAVLVPTTKIKKAIRVCRWIDAAIRQPLHYLFTN